MSLLSDLAETVKRLDTGTVWVYDRNAKLRVWLMYTGAVAVYGRNGQCRVWLDATGAVAVYDRNGQIRAEATL